MRIILSLALIVATSTVNAALVSRLGGLAIYDDVADLTWLQDANYAKTSGYHADGAMPWAESNNWVASLTVSGVSGWRLPDTLQPDPSCGSQYDPGGGFDIQGYDFNCTGSEMGDLFYNALSNTAGSLSNTGSFSNVDPNTGYWSATEYAPETIDAWLFDMDNGEQYNTIKARNLISWAVHDGDVGAAVIPVPAAVWLFGSGLVGLIGLARRKTY